MAIVTNKRDQVLVQSIEDVYPLLYARIIELIIEHKMGRIFVIDEDTTVDYCFDWKMTDEGRAFWINVHFNNIEAAQVLQPHLFGKGKKTFVNCFGVEIVEQTQIRADDDVAVDFTKKKRLSDY